MAHIGTVEKELLKLFYQRTYYLRSKLGIKTKGKAPKLTRKKIDNAVAKIQDLASTMMARGLAKTQFETHANDKQSKRITARGWRNQKRQFESWFDESFPLQNIVVYVFWKGKRCIYVGRTGRGGSRPSSHFKVKGFNPTRIDVYPCKKSYAPRLECLALHRFEPTINSYIPSKAKWTKRCPLCDTHKHINQELRGIFRLRK